MLAHVLVTVLLLLVMLGSRLVALAQYNDLCYDVSI